jgi:hypothetical protein
MRGRLKVRLTVEALLGVVSLGLAILTAISSEWIEELTGLEPDAGSGTFEWTIVVAFALAAIAFGALALRHGRRLRQATT